jgi:lipopolysaccharide export system permease protein
MSILDRYIGRQIASSAFFAVAVLSVVLVLGNAFKQLFELLLNRNAPADIILSFLRYILPFSLTYTIPWGFLTAVLLVFGRMSAEYELIALRSSGISFPRICRMVAVLGLLCSGICLWISVDFGPRAQADYKQAIYNLAINRPLSLFEGDKVIDSFPGHKIYVGHSDGKQLHNLLVFELGSGSEPKNFIFARRGKIRPDIPNRRLLLEIFDAHYEERDRINPDNLSKMRHGITVQSTTLPIPLTELLDQSKNKRRLSTMTVGELKQELAGGTPLGQDVGRARELSEVRWELNRRFAFAFASVALGLIAVPLGITAQRKETSAGFLLSIVVAFVYFFLMLMVGWVKGRPEWHPEWLVWAPNAVFLGLGAVLFGRLAAR